jgi:hypothetical protein
LVFRGELQAEEAKGGHEEAQERHAGHHDLNHQRELSVNLLPEFGEACLHFLPELSNLLAELELVGPLVVKPPVKIVNPLGEFGLGHDDPS